MKAYVLCLQTYVSWLISRTRSFAKSPKLFAKTCADLFARMVDTVPKGVKLTEIIEPLPVKPQKAHIVVQNDGTFALRGEVRVRVVYDYHLCSPHGGPTVLEHSRE
jgi:hypothetical protein